MGIFLDNSWDLRDCVTGVGAGTCLHGAVQMFQKLPETVFLLEPKSMDIQKTCELKTTAHRALALDSDSNEALKEKNVIVFGQKNSKKHDIDFGVFHPLSSEKTPKSSYPVSSPRGASSPSPRWHVVASAE